MIIVKNGEIELFVEIDGYIEFVVERLGSGGILNPTAIFIEEFSSINVRCSKSGTILLLSKSKIDFIMSINEKIFRQISMRVDKFMK